MPQDIVILSCPLEQYKYHLALSVFNLLFGLIPALIEFLANFAWISITKNCALRQEYYHDNDKVMSNSTVNNNIWEA